MSACFRAALALINVFLVGQVQSGRATVDSAEYGQQMLKIARNQLEVSQRSLKQGFVAPSGFGDLKQSDDPDEPVGYGALADETSEVDTNNDVALPKPQEEIAVADETIAHNGMQIERRGEDYLLGEMVFPNLSFAKMHVNTLQESSPSAAEKTTESSEAALAKVSNRICLTT